MIWGKRTFIGNGATYVDFACFESLFQVVVDCFIGYFAYKRKICDTNGLFLCALENSFFDLRPTRARLRAGLWLCRIFLPARTLRNSL